MICAIVTLIIGMAVIILISTVIAYIAVTAQDYYDEYRMKKRNKKLDN